MQKKNKQAAYSLFKFNKFFSLFFFIIVNFLIMPNSFSLLKDINKHPEQFKKVTIDGVIFKRLGGKNYLVQDGSGIIKVSIPADITPEKGFFPKDHVHLEGVINLSYGNKVRIDVNTITFSF